jgi:hypothetical protein
MSIQANLKFDGYVYFWEAFGFQSMAFVDRNESNHHLKLFERLLNEPVQGTVQ